MGAVLAVEGTPIEWKETRFLLLTRPRFHASRQLWRHATPILSILRTLCLCVLSCVCVCVCDRVRGEASATISEWLKASLLAGCMSVWGCTLSSLAATAHYFWLLSRCLLSSFLKRFVSARRVEVGFLIRYDTSWCLLDECRDWLLHFYYLSIDPQLSSRDLVCQILPNPFSLHHLFPLDRVEWLHSIDFYVTLACRTFW